MTPLPAPAPQPLRPPPAGQVHPDLARIIVALARANAARDYAARLAAQPKA